MAPNTGPRAHPRPQGTSRRGKTGVGMREGMGKSQGKGIGKGIGKSAPL
jgi:hypothetical protein